MRIWNSKNGGKDTYLIATPAPSPSSLHLERQPHYLFMTTLYWTAFHSQTRFKEQAIIVVIALVEVEAVLSLHEPLLRQRDDFPRRRRRNIPIDLLHEEIIEWEHGEDRERGRGGDGRCHCTPFGKTTRWRAEHALARRAAWARSLTTMEWLEWLVVDNVERVLARFGRGNLSPSSSFAVFTCAISGICMTRARRDLK